MAHDLEKKWRSRDVQLQENVDFSALLLCDRVLYGLKKTGFKKPSPIQLEAIPLSKIGKDLLVQAKSGTGKTLVFVITALEMLRRKLFRPQVLIIVPTREIATQVCSVVKAVGTGFSKLTCFSFIGGMSLSDDIENARTCQIVVGTPGRINQLIREKSLPTNSIRLLVFDEADQLLQMSFKEDINNIFAMLPDDKQVITTSATYPIKLKKLLFKYLREPHIACLNTREIALLGIVHYARLVKNSPMPVIQYKIKLLVLETILKTVKFSQCLVFCNGIQRVEVLHKDIKKWGFSSTYISSAKEQCDRLKAIDRLKHFKCKVLVSSDVTARGIDAENVDLVINFDLAFGIDTYMHRAGRAGRYGSIGVSISIIEENKVVYLKRMESEVSFKTYKLPDPIPEDLIQNTNFGEYFIEEEQLQNSEDEGSATLDEATINNLIHNKSNVVDNQNNLVDSENNLIENPKTENEGLVPKSESTSNVNDCVSETQVSTDKISVEASEIACNLSFKQSDELQQISTEGEVKNIDLSENENHLKLLKVDKGVQDNVSNMLTSDFFVSNDLSDGDLNCVIKTFLDGYETNGLKYLELNDKEEESEVVNSSEKKIISVCRINDLNFKKSSYVYEVCKKYQTEKNEESRISSEDKVNEISAMSLQNGVGELDNSLPSLDNSLQTAVDSLSDSANKQSDGNPVVKPQPERVQQSTSHLSGTFSQNLKHPKELTPDDTSDCEMSTSYRIRCIMEGFYERLNNQTETLFQEPSETLLQEPSKTLLQEPTKASFQEPSIQPKCESSPLLNAKFQDNSMPKSAIDDEPNNELVPNCKSCLFRNVSESDSDDTEFSEDDIDVSQEFSSSDDSEEESSCDFSDSSSSEEEYHHNKSRTGKQNPSLVSSSASDFSERISHSKCRQDENFSKYSHSGCLKSHQPIHCSSLKYYPHYPSRCSQNKICNFLRGSFRGQGHFGRSLCCKHHVAQGRSCFQPSEQRCNNSSCNQAQACSHWHTTFYNQWRYLQNCINSVHY